MGIPRFGLNRFDSRSVDTFATDVRRAETLGWDAAFQPDSQLRRRDTYVLLAAAARATERITLGPLLANPVNRHPTASSIATIDELARGRVLLGWGIGDTAVLRGGSVEIAERLVDTLRAAPAELDYVVLHPIPNPPSPDDGDRGYMARIAREVLPRVRRAVAGR